MLKLVVHIVTIRPWRVTQEDSLHNSVYILLKLQRLMGIVSLWELTHSPDLTHWIPDLIVFLRYSATFYTESQLCGGSVSNNTHLLRISIFLLPFQIRKARIFYVLTRSRHFFRSSLRQEWPYSNTLGRWMHSLLFDFMTYTCNFIRLVTPLR